MIRLGFLLGSLDFFGGIFPHLVSWTVGKRDLLSDDDDCNGDEYDDYDDYDDNNIGNRKNNTKIDDHDKNHHEKDTTKKKRKNLYVFLCCFALSRSRSLVFGWFVGQLVSTSVSSVGG